MSRGTKSSLVTIVFFYFGRSGTEPYLPGYFGLIATRRKPRLGGISLSDDSAAASGR